MNKNKHNLVTFDRYAIIDLPIEVCIQRAIELCENKSFGDAQFVSDDRLDIVYQFEGHRHYIDGIVSLTRWHGTQTRVALTVPIDDDPYDDMPEFWSQIVFVLYFFGALMLSFMFQIDGRLNAWVILIALIGGYLLHKYLPKIKLNVYRYQPLDMSNYLETEWNVLLVMLASDKTGIMASLIEQGDAEDLYDETYFEDVPIYQESNR